MNSSGFGFGGGGGGGGGGTVHVADLAFVNVVTRYGVDNTGVADAGPTLAAAFTALAATGQVPWLPKGTYKMTTAAPPPVGMPVWVAGPGNVIFTGPNAASVANVALVYGEPEGSPSYNPAWFALTDVYLDPVAGLDNNTGMVGSPVKTMAEVIRRYGNIMPTLPFGQNLTIHQLSAQTAGVDAFFFWPAMLGGGNFAWLGAASTVGAPFSPTTVTPKVSTSVGNDLRMTGALPGGILAGQYIHNITRNSYAFVDSIAAGVATITQPFTAATVTTISPIPVLTEDNGWVNTDSYQLYQPLLCNMKAFQPQGGDAAVNGGVNWIQGIYVPDSFGSPGVSTFQVAPQGGPSCILSLCAFDAFLSLIGVGGYFTETVSCWCNGGIQLTEADCVGGAANTAGVGGIFLQFSAGLDGDVILHGTANASGFNTFVGRAHVLAAMNFGQGCQAYLDSTIAGLGALIWGAGAIDVTEATLRNGTGSSWVSQINVGAMTINGGGFGQAQASGYVLGDIAVTPANLDVYHALASPGGTASYDDGANTATLTPPTWAQADWYIDPVGGLDTNAGTALSPVKTIMGGVVTRWGTRAPVLVQDTTLRLVKAQPLGQEAVVLEPILVGANFIIIGTPSVLSASFSPSVVTPKVRGTPGTLLSIDIGGLVAGQVVHNITRGSRAFVDSVAVSVNTMTQPFADAGLATVTPTPALVEDNGWLTTDNYELLALPLLNLKVLNAQGGDQNGAFTKGTCWVQNVYIPDASGTPGTSQLTPNAQACVPIFMSCWIDPFFTLDGTFAVTRPWAGDCWLNGGATMQNQAAMVGGAAGTVSGYGCTLKNGAAIDGDAIVHGGSDFTGLVGYVYVDSAIALGHLNANPLVLSPIQLATGGGATAQMWGPGSLNAGEATGACVQNATGGTWANCLTLAALTVDGSATASAFDAGALGNPYTPGIVVNAANLDTYNGLQNPRTLSRFATN